MNKGLSESSKPVILVITATVIVFAATVLIMFFDKPKYNDIKDIKVTVSATVSEAVTTANEESVNINTADAEDLTKLFGIGEKRASDIIEYREKNGRFRSIEELTNVNGISESVLQKNADIITV
jgi:comEA protein